MQIDRQHREGEALADRELRSQLVAFAAEFAADTLDALSKNQRAMAALATLRSIFAPTTTAARDSPSVDQLLLTKVRLAKVLAKSVASIDRFDREGAPHTYCGDSKRYELGAYRAWLAQRGKRPTRATKRDAVVDIDDVVAGARLREVAQ